MFRRMTRRHPAFWLLSLVAAPFFAMACSSTQDAAGGAKSGPDASDDASTQDANVAQDANVTSTQDANVTSTQDADASSTQDADASSTQDADASSADDADANVAPVCTLGAMRCVGTTGYEVCVPCGGTSFSDQGPCPNDAGPGVMWGGGAAPCAGGSVCTDEGNFARCTCPTGESSIEGTCVADAGTD
jgi:hypothetical protein